MLPEVSSERHIRILRLLLIISFVVFAAVVRALPHPWNFTPIGAMALFSGAKLGRSWQAFLYPLSALFVGDLFVGFHRLMPIVYLSFCLSVLIGMLFRRTQTPGRLALATFLAALQFFIFTNFAIWAVGTTYAKSAVGLFTCYVAGLPYFGNTLAGDAFYATILFGSFAFVEYLNPSLKVCEPLSAR
ncbi:MAG TPA: DUF6580 family putative transport protein [Candidatus Acidoferrum sp.]